MNERPIINADDFGLSAEVNQAILTSFRNGWINSASLMANMPGFGGACSMLDSEKLQGRIGVHLNLSAGRPLTDGIAHCSRFCDAQGMFRPRSGSFRQSALRLSAAERKVVREELAAQIQACVEGGLRPTHLDSHHHQHTEWAVGGIVIDLARENGIHGVRIMRNYPPGRGLLKHLYRELFNARLRHFALARTRFFGDIRDPGLLLSCGQDVEIMVHPQLRQGTVVDREDTPLGQLVMNLRSTG